MGGSYWVAVGTLVLSDLCSMMLWAVCPKAHHSPPPRAVAMRISVQLVGLESLQLCWSNAKCPSGAPLQLQPGRWAQAPLIIEQKYCSYRHISLSFSPTAVLMLMSGVLLFHLGMSGFAVGLTPPVLRMGLLSQQILPLPYEFASSISVASHCCFFLSTSKVVLSHSFLPLLWHLPWLLGSGGMLVGPGTTQVPQSQWSPGMG